ncbi:MAG: glycosyltransferase, partial [Actinobacteria bacterium]|nr:glycosyltransferase [Actinomycetota bacterium]
MKRLPLVSVVTPVLNRRALIERCLRSVSAQSYGAIEHIVVDGGSTDGTVDAIASFQSDKDLRWISRADGGMYEAVNRGLSMARGEIVAYINSDDVYLPWSVEAAVEGLRNGVDLVFGDLGVLIRGTGRPGFSLQFYPRFDLRYYTYEATLAQPTVFFRRGLLDALGPFDTSYG